MKVDVKKLPQSMVELTITVPYEMIQEAEKKALEKLSKELNVPGFRPGHVPADMVKEKITEEGLRLQTMEQALPDSYAKAVTDNKIAVIAPPKVDIVSRVEKAGDSLVYKATVAVMPEVKVGNYKKIKVKRGKVEVKPEQIEEAIQMVLDRFASWKQVTDRPAKKGDRVELTFEGFDEEGKALPNTASKNHPLILGSNAFVPGFEDQVVGMNVNDTKEFTVRFPKDYHAEPMRDKNVTFKATVGFLEEKNEQALDEAFIEKVTGTKQSVADFRKRVEEDLMEEMKMRADQEHDGKVVNEIIKITEGDIPEVMIEEEIAQLKEEQKKRVESQGLTWEQYLKHMKKSDEDFAKEHRKPAEERLRARLGVQFILKDAAIVATDEDAEAKVKEVEERYPEAQRADIRKYYAKDSEAYRNLKNNLAADKLINFLSD